MWKDKHNIKKSKEPLEEHRLYHKEEGQSNKTKVSAGLVRNKIKHEITKHHAKNTLHHKRVEVDIGLHFRAPKCSCYEQSLLI